jgi:hypothetical protein
MKSARLQWESHTMCLRDRRNTVHKKCLVEKSVVRCHMEDQHMEIDLREITCDDKLD